MATVFLRMIYLLGLHLVGFSYYLALLSSASAG